MLVGCLRHACERGHVRSLWMRPAASGASNLLRHDLMRQLNLTQLTHLFWGATLPETGAKQGIWHLAASECLRHESLRQFT